MLYRRVALSVVLLATAVSVVACAPKVSLTPAPQQTKVATTAPANPTPAPTTANPSAPSVTLVRVVNEPVSPPPQDPILGTKKYGTRSDKVHGASIAVTNDLHIDVVESAENKRLIRQQSSELLCIFRHNKGVRRLVDKYGGDACDAVYYVREINANEDDAGNSTAWVTATLRADFSASEGKRAIEMQVYRRKISPELLDNTPYIASTQAGWVGRTGDLVGIDGPDGSAENAIIDIRFKN